jgi:TrmH family RNA methyltransferase
VARAAALLQQLPADVQALLLPDEIFDSAVATETPQGVAALLYPLAAAPEALFRTSRGAPGSPRALCADNQEPLILGCAGLQDPGNLGTILRSAEAFGASGVLCTEGTVAAANPKVARSSAGSVFRLPCVRLSMAEAVAALRRHGVRLAVTSSHAIGGAKAQPVQQVELTGPVAIFIGSEGRGVPAPLLEAADVAITIPHAEQVESLNAGIAASIVLYEAWRQRSR